MSRDEATISKGRFYEEIGEYWDKHDVSEVWDRTEPVELEVDIRSEKHYALPDECRREHPRPGVGIDSSRD